MADYASSRASVIARATSFLNRPNQSPMGPRTRNRASHLPQAEGSGSPPPASPTTASSTTTPPIYRVSTTPSNPPYLPEFGPPLAAVESPALTSISEGPDAEGSAADSPVLEELPEPQLPPTPLAPPTITVQDSSNGPNSDDIESNNAPNPETADEPLPAEQVIEQADTLATQVEGEAPKEQAEQPVEGPLTPIEEPTKSTLKEPVPAEESPHVESMEEHSGSTPSTTPSSLPTSLPPVAPPLPSASTPNLKLAANPPKLIRPPAIKFESPPVQWKGLPLEAAMWTFESRELQSIVSRAIRSSAQESYIRLLAIDILDNVLPIEVERLEAQKSMTQAKYRFLVHRRTMQLQALLSSSLAPRTAKETEEGILTSTRLVVQISETTAECDQLMEALLKTTDQLGQIKRLLDHHWASALAIALRKLNGSYARRTSELSMARERITQLQAELEDAWAEAEKLALEMDDLDAALSDDEAIIETAERVCVTPGPDSRPMSPTILSLQPSSSSSRPASHHRRSSSISPTTTTNNKLNPGITQLPPLSPISPLTIKSGVPMRQSIGIETPVDVPDSVSIKSTRSTKSARSYRSSGRETHASIVSAAKKRSLRASQSSLRLPPGFTGSGHKRSGSRPKTPYDTEDQPPVPDLPPHFSSVMHSLSSNPTSSLFESTFDGKRNSLGPFRHGRRTSLDSARVTNGHLTPLPWSGTMDDLYVKSARSEMSFYDPGSSSRHYQGDEIQVVERTPPPAPPRMISMEEYSARPRPKPRSKPEGSEAPLRQNIPSIWMNVDAPKTPAERVDSLMRNSSSKGNTYQRLRGLTKRYSLPFPLFSSKANNGSQQALAGRTSSQRSG